jgi:hypothetical protein
VRDLQGYRLALNSEETSLWIAAHFNNFKKYSNTILRIDIVSNFIASSSYHS